MVPLDYIKVFEMWEVHEKVISNLDLDYTYADMARMADYVIVDAPPVGMVIDIAEIAKACDGALIAVHYNDVSRQELLDVKQQIEQTGCPILGTVLNQVDYDNYMGRKYYKSYSKYGKYGYYRKYYKRSHEAEKK